jgi:hypothetical protein
LKSIPSDLPQFLLFSQEKTSPRKLHSKFFWENLLKEIKVHLFFLAQNRSTSPPQLLSRERNRKKMVERDSLQRACQPHRINYSYKDIIEPFRERQRINGHAKFELKNSNFEAVFNKPTSVIFVGKI